MKQPLLLLAAIAALGLVYVIFPVVTDAFMNYRKRRNLTCPEEKKAASIQIDAKIAALTAAQGKLQLRVRDCSLWPEKRDCAQRCLAQLS
jgi:hypothetical protein